MVDHDKTKAQLIEEVETLRARVAALEQLHRAGLQTFAVVQPILPMDPARLVSLVAPHVGFVRVDRMHSMEQAMPLYRAAGRAQAATDDFFERTGRELREAFGRAGIAVDDLDDMRAMVAS